MSSEFQSEKRRQLTGKLVRLDCIAFYSRFHLFIMGDLNFTLCIANFLTYQNPPIKHCLMPKTFWILLEGILREYYLTLTKTTIKILPSFKFFDVVNNRAPAASRTGNFILKDPKDVLSKKIEKKKMKKKGKGRNGNRKTKFCRLPLALFSHMYGTSKRRRNYLRIKTVFGKVGINKLKT